VPAHQALAEDPTAAARGAAVPLSDGTAEASDEELEPETGGGVATEVAVVEEQLEEVEDALASGELAVEEAEVAEGVIAEAAEIALADEVAEEVAADEGDEEARDGA
jgi:hypothetical protein